MLSTKITKLALLPAYDNEETIARVVLLAQRHVDEVVVVDDGSHDMTALIAERIGAKVLRHDRNLGKGAALRTGFDYARQSGADLVVTLDSDGQHDPNDIPNVVDPILRHEADIVIGEQKILEGRPKVQAIRWKGT